jgi:hypothetical protein
MSVIVQVIGASSGVPTPHDGRWVVEWNPHVPFGTLALTSTDDPAKAKRFPSFEDVMRQRRTVSHVQAYRPDGQPNRPLSGIDIEIKNAP